MEILSLIVKITATFSLVFSFVSLVVALLHAMAIEENQEEKVLIWEKISLVSIVVCIVIGVIAKIAGVPME